MGRITRETDSMGGGGLTRETDSMKCGAKQEISAKCKVAPQGSVTADRHAMSGHSPKVPPPQTQRRHRFSSGKPQQNRYQTGPKNTTVTINNDNNVQRLLTLLLLATLSLSRQNAGTKAKCLCEALHIRITFNCSYLHDVTNSIV